MEALDYLRQIFWALVAPTSIRQLVTAFFVSLVPYLLFVWFVAYSYSRWVYRTREDLTTSSRVRLAVGWGFTVGALVLFLDLVSIQFFGQIPDLLSALPLLVDGLMSLLVSFVCYRSVRSDVTAMQRILQKV